MRRHQLPGKWQMLDKSFPNYTCNMVAVGKLGKAMFKEKCKPFSTNPIDKLQVLFLCVATDAASQLMRAAPCHRSSNCLKLECRHCSLNSLSHQNGSETQWLRKPGESGLRMSTPATSCDFSCSAPPAVTRGLQEPQADRLGSSSPRLAAELCTSGCMRPPLPTLTSPLLYF